MVGERRDARDKEVGRPTLHHVESGRMAESSTWVCSRAMSSWSRIPSVPSKRAARVRVARDRRNNTSRKHSLPLPSCRVVEPTSEPLTNRSWDRLRGVKRTALPTPTSIVVSLRSHVRLTDRTSIHCPSALPLVARVANRVRPSRVPNDSPPSVENLAGKFPRARLGLGLSQTGRGRETETVCTREKRSHCECQRITLARY